jgi:hypothetical protein
LHCGPGKPEEGRASRTVKGNEGELDSIRDVVYNRASRATEDHQSELGSVHAVV